MTVEELIKQLEAFPPKLPVILPQSAPFHIEEVLISPEYYRNRDTAPMSALQPAVSLGRCF